jgi:hypothetical protein
MATYRSKHINGEPAFEVPMSDILAQVEDGGGLKVLTPVEYVTDGQRKWYKGVALPWLVKHDPNQESKDWWDTEVKRICNGLGLLKKQVYFIESIAGQKIPIGRLTTTGVGIRNMTQFIEEILAMSVTKNWGIAPPDKELRRK